MPLEYNSMRTFFQVIIHYGQEVAGFVYHIAVLSVPVHWDLQDLTMKGMMVVEPGGTADEHHMCGVHDP